MLIWGRFSASWFSGPREQGQSQEAVVVGTRFLSLMVVRPTCFQLSCQCVTLSSLTACILQEWPSCAFREMPDVSSLLSTMQEMAAQHLLGLAKCLGRSASCWSWGHCLWLAVGGLQPLHLGSYSPVFLAALKGSLLCLGNRIAPRTIPHQPAGLWSPHSHYLVYGSRLSSHFSAPCTPVPEGDFSPSFLREHWSSSDFRSG